MPNFNLASRFLPNRQLVGDEKIVLFLRRHWIVLLSKYFFLLLLALIPFVSYFLVGDAFPGFPASETSKAILILVGSLYYLFIWVTVYTLFLEYYLGIWIVTNHRIVEIEQRGLFHHVVSEQSLDKVQDISANSQGVFSTLFGYGNVLVETAGAQNLFEFLQIPEPEQTSRIIANLAQEFEDRHKGEILKQSNTVSNLIN